MQSASAANPYSKVIANSKRVRWDIDKTFLPAGLSLVNELDFLTPNDRRLLSQVQGRSYAYIFGLVERFIGAKVLDISRQHALGDQVALEALLRMADEELKHQELFRRIEGMIAAGMADGYRFDARPNDVARVVLGKSTWAVLALICMIELFTQEHYRASIAPESGISELYKDVFLFHWREESQHAILDELEWRRENARITPAQRDSAVNDLIALAGAVDGIVQQQAQADSEYFLAARGHSLSPAEGGRVRNALLAAYRWQYIVSGAQDERFSGILGEMITPAQGARIAGALAPIVESVQAHT
jgi:hypothetical protein